MWSNNVRSVICNKYVTQVLFHKWQKERNNMISKIYELELGEHNSWVSCHLKVFRRIKYLYSWWWNCMPKFLLLEFILSGLAEKLSQLQNPFVSPPLCTTDGIDGIIKNKVFIHICIGNMGFHHLLSNAPVQLMMLSVGIQDKINSFRTRFSLDKKFAYIVVEWSFTSEAIWIKMAWVSYGLYRAKASQIKCHLFSWCITTKRGIPNKWWRI